MREADEQSEPRLPGAARIRRAFNQLNVLTTVRPLRGSDVQLYRICEDLTEVLIYLMVLFGPWAFGTSEPWSIRTMNAAGLVLGALLAIKLAIRWRKGYRPPRWDTEALEVSRRQPLPGRETAPFRFKVMLAVLSVLLPAYCLISALNARARYTPQHHSFEYYNCVPWLPHSFDANATWFAFWTLLGLACSFWAICDWLPGKSDSEQRPGGNSSSAGRLDLAPLFPARLRRLLWVLALNGGLLGLEAIIQRLENSPKLLFLVIPQIHRTADTQFGPYAYRANAAQYFNLLWPVCVGFWWMLNRSYGSRRKAHHVLLLCGLITASCPIISTSRGGAIVAVAIVVLAALCFLATHWLFKVRRDETRKGRVLALRALAAFFVVVLAMGFFLGWKALKPRMAKLDEGFAGRERMYTIVQRMADDYPVFGTGPGTFESVSELYRPPTDEFWPAQVHNDWLETRITFGWMGSILIYLALATVLLRWFARGGIHGGRRFVILTWLAIGGCLVHARYDFPFQIHSIVFLFLVLCAVLFNLSRRP